jgi:hypothetical protein
MIPKGKKDKTKADSSSDKNKPSLSHSDSMKEDKAAAPDAVKNEKLITNKDNRITNQENADVDAI